jgi:chromosome segregation ATPase
MAKQEADVRRREVGNKDLEIVDKAINDHEVFQKDLYVLRRVLSEVGNLDQQYRGLKEAVEAVQSEATRTSAQLEQVRAELATVQVEVVEKRKELATLSAEVAEKERALSAFSASIDRITGARAACDQLIIKLQELSSDYDEHEAFAAAHAKAKAERDIVSRELQQFRLALSDLKLEYQDKRQALGQLMADIVRRNTELDRINCGIEQAKQRAFGG